MENYYDTLGVAIEASPTQIKKAFRERAKKAHPDITGNQASQDMRRLLTAYETLSDPERRKEYDRAYFRFVKKVDFDYRSFLKEDEDNPESQAKLIFFDLLHLEEDEAIEVWRRMGALDFAMEDLLDREDWMDCSFILAEELDQRGYPYDAFQLLIRLVEEEKRKPYFKHFMPEVDGLVKEIVRVRLAAAVPDDVYAECLEEMLDLGYPRKEESRWLRDLAMVLERLGDSHGAAAALRDALTRDSGLNGVVQLRRRLGV